MIFFLEGLPKAGKSYELVRRTGQALKSGQVVATTMNIDVPALCGIEGIAVNDCPDVFKIEGLNQTENFTHGLVIIDEAAARIHARDWYEMTPETRSKFSQHMHDSLDVWLAAQEFDTVDPIVRGLVAYCYRVEPKSMFWVKGYYLDTFIPAGRKINRNQPAESHWHKFDKRYYAVYNYHEYERSGEHGMRRMQDYVADKKITF